MENLALRVLIRKHAAVRVACGLPQPVQHGFAYPHAVGRVRQPPVRPLPLARQMTHQHQLVLRARHRHIEQPRALAHLLAHPLIADGEGQRGFARGAGLAGYVFQRHAQLRVRAQGGGPVAQGQALPQPQHKHHGELQPLGFVYRHHAHHVLPWGHHAGPAPIPAEEGCFGFLQKPVQVALPVLLRVVGHGAQQPKVALPFATAALRAVKGVQPAAVQKVPQIHAQAAAAQQKPLLLKARQHAARLRGKRRVAARAARERVVKRHALFRCAKANVAQLRVRQLKHRPAQRGQQAQVVHRVVQQAQAAERLRHLGRVQRARAALHLRGDAAFAQHPLHHVAHALGLGQQNGHIPVMIHAVRLALAVALFRADQREDALGC